LAHRTLAVANNETGLEVNGEKSKYMVTTRQQNAGTNRNINTGNKAFKGMKQFNYLKTTLTKQTLFRKKSRAG
jgi:hypothetical protein